MSYREFPSSDHCKFDEVFANSVSSETGPVVINQISISAYKSPTRTRLKRSDILSPSRMKYSKCSYEFFQHFPKCLLCQYLEFLDVITLGIFGGTCRRMRKAVQECATRDSIIACCLGPFTAQMDKISNKGNYFSDKMKWDIHNCVCDMCELSSPDLNCFTCNLAFHTNCLSLSRQNHAVKTEVNNSVFQCPDCTNDDALPARGFCHAVLAPDGSIVVTGGRHSNFVANSDMYSLHPGDGDNGEWSFLSCSGQQPESAFLNLACTVVDLIYGPRIWAFPFDNTGPDSLTTAGAFFREACVLDVQTRSWSRVSLSENTLACRPAPKLAYACVQSPAPYRGSLVVHGGWRSRGFGSCGPVTELHMLDTERRRWRCISVDGSRGSPTARSAHTLTRIGSQVWLFGGLGESPEEAGRDNRGGKRPRVKPLNDVFVLTLRRRGAGAEAVWESRVSTGRRPAKRSGHSACSVGPHLLVCGGANGTEYLSCTDVHVLNTATGRWSSLAYASGAGPIPLLTPRLRPVMLSLGGKSRHDERVLIFGGGLLEDTPSMLDEQTKSDGVIIRFV